MNFVYNKNGQRLPPFALKEWDFYQIVCGRKVIQMTIGHISYFSQLSANVIDLDTGKRECISKLILGSRKIKKQLAPNPQLPSKTQYFGRKLKMQFEVTDKGRRLTLSRADKLGVFAEIDVTLTNVGAEKDKMVIATPFDNPKQWYLNYKENCFVANGYVRIGSMEVDVKDGNAVLDWGRGVWPRKHSWTWGNGSAVVDGKHFGFNIGWGFGNTQNATENMFFYDNKAYKLQDVKEVQNGDKLRYIDSDKKFVFDVEPIYDNFTQTKAVVVNNSCHQVWGLWRGHVVLDDGTKLKIPPFIAFCEHAENNW
ncbi:MAG: DUF2804 domain-containing protein [Corallococcus sp.]|nr:DUF2804 domain-containing protein [Corallococcus sp.]MCM1360056.1 DUF2804 domain-containing protein [Corallococcus sp.]